MNESGTVEEQAFLAGIIADPGDDLRRLMFADWLEENGREPQAKLIRARIELDSGVPEFGTYVDALEAVQNCGYVLPAVKLPSKYFTCTPPAGLAECWASDAGWYERGLPAVAEFSEYGSDIRLKPWLKAIDEIYTKTPIRAFRLANIMYDDAEGLFPAVARPELRRLDLDARADENDDSGIPPDYCARLLTELPVARTLRRLDIKGTINIGTAMQLERATFGQLEHFGWDDYSDLYDTTNNLFAGSSWLPQLRSFAHTLWGDAIFGPAMLSKLHSFSLSAGDAMSRQRVPYIGGVELPNLKRLYLCDLSLRGAASKSIVKMACGDLVELWLRRIDTRSFDLKQLLAAPWARRLEVLVLEDIPGDAAEAIGESSCAAHLRILRLDGNAVPTLDCLESLPKLTTLELSKGEHTGAKPLGYSYAELLKRLHLPGLRTVRVRGKELKTLRRAFESNSALKDCRLVFV